MKRFAKLLIIALGFGALGFLMSLVPQKNARGSGSAPVNIMSPLPLPVTGNISAAVTGTVGISGAPNVVVSNTPNVNANITNNQLSVQEPGTPFAINLCVQVNSNCSGDQASYSIPSTNHLIVEYVSGNCTVSSGSAPTSVNGIIFAMTTGGTFVTPIVAFPYFPPPQGAPGTVFFASFSQPTRLYGDPGTAIILNVARTIQPDATLSCIVTLSGRLTTP